MPKLGTVLETIFKKAGIDTKETTLAPVFANDTEISEDIEKALGTGLLTVAAAKSNPDITKYFRQSILGIADKKMDEIITEMGLQPDDAFVANTNTYEKLGLLTKMIHEAGKKGAKAGDKDWTAKELEYQNQLKTLKEGFDTKEKGWSEREATINRDAELRTILSGFNYALPKEMALGNKVKLAQSVILDKLAAQGLTLKFDTTLGKNIIVNADGQPAYNDKHEAITPDTFYSAALAGDKLLAVNDLNDQVITPGQPGAPITVPGAAATVVGNKAILGEIDEQLNSDIFK